LISARLPCRGLMRSQQTRTVEERTKNGVHVRVERVSDENGPVGSVVLADCQCFGHPLRVHSTEFCPNRLAQIAAREGTS
jgi:hypothetical protein